MANPGFDHPVVTAPGMAPEARYAERVALDRAYDDITGTVDNCAQCGQRHMATFEYQGRLRGWHEQLEDIPRRIVSRGRR